MRILRSIRRAVAGAPHQKVFMLNHFPSARAQGAAGTAPRSLPFRLASWFSFLVLCTLMLAGTRSAHADDAFLDPQLAFKFTAHMQDAATIAVTYEIADGYYMYRDRFKFSASGATLGTPQIPPGKVKFDENFGKNVETYHHALTITIPVRGTGPFTLIATGQGCSEKGLCYPPQEARATLDITGAGSGFSTPAPASAAPAEPGEAPAGDVGRIESALKGGSLLVIMPLFALLGLGLAFTPCMLPMVPILSSIIVGEGTAAKRSRGLSLSLVYSLGMALVYTGLGVAAGLAGEGLAATLQNPWVLGGVALLMAGLSLSMFGVYDLQVPSALQARLAAASNQQASGRFAGVFAMGAISALIVGPCVAAPLAGALVYISQTRDVLIGGSALFAMAVGMSVPLILVGLSAGTLLPRAGAWMDTVKRFFGVLLLAVAWWLVAPVLPPTVQMLGWAVLGLGYGGYLLTKMRGWGARAAGIAFALLGVLQVVGVATGGRDALAPLAHLRPGGALPARQPLAFKRVKTLAELDAALAATGGKSAMLDFYADWCVSCKEMEKLTFVDPRVKASLAGTILLQVDVTANDADDKAMLKRFGLFGPPGIILFDARGKEIPRARVIGYQNAEQFLVSLSRLQ
jgi:thiol:disulfide interchange protein DsbD